MSEKKGNWLILQVTMGEEDPLHLIAAGVEHEVYVLGIDSGGAKLHIDGAVITCLTVGDINSRARADVGGRPVEMWIKSTEGSKAKIAIRGPEVLVLRHKLWLKDNAA